MHALAGDSRECRPRGTAHFNIVCRVLEMQIIILALLENFEFSLPPQNENTKIRRKPCQIMLPQAEGEKGVWMGLIIKPVN